MKHILTAALIAMTTPVAAADAMFPSDATCTAYIAARQNPNLFHDHVIVYFDGMFSGASFATNQRQMSETFTAICMADPSKTVGAVFAEAVRKLK